jgi:hypothetical protein
MFIITASVATENWQELQLVLNSSFAGLRCNLEPNLR